MKFWYKPEFNAKTGFYFDDPRLDPLAASTGEHGEQVAGPGP